jgi:signal transduction histidine kinase
MLPAASQAAATCFKYNRDQGAVTISAAATNSGKLRIAITDTGPGIPVGRYGEVFRPFSRLGMEASNVEGTGIGLAISRQMIESMDGRLEFESTVGEGSTFWLELPFA